MHRALLIVGALALAAGLGWAALLDPPKVVMQLRALAVAGGGAVLLGVALRGPALGAVLLAWLATLALLPDAARYTAPWVALGAGAGSALVGLFHAIRPGDGRERVLLPLAVVGAATGVAAGLDGALLLALALFAAPLRGRAALIAPALAGVGLALVVRAGLGVPGFPTLAVALGALGPLLAFGRDAARHRAPALAAVIAAAPALFVRPSPSPGEWLAEQIDTRRLPVDDVTGWRRLWKLEHPPVDPSAADAGP